MGEACAEGKKSTAEAAGWRACYLFKEVLEEF